MSAPQITLMLTGLPLATLATIDIQKLRSNDSAEKQKLLAAAKEDGFFYLSLEALPELDEVEGVVSGINDLERDLFGLSDEEKMEFDVDKQGVMKLNGYNKNFLIYSPQKLMYEKVQARWEKQRWS
jgi:isopenicillin N synthase-like dioxygenase